MKKHYLENWEVTAWGIDTSQDDPVTIVVDIVPGEEREVFLESEANWGTFTNRLIERLRLNEEKLANTSRRLNNEK